jgi:hypothetical protein
MFDFIFIPVFRIRTVFIGYGYGSGSSILGWIPIRIRIQSGSRVFGDQKLKKITAKNYIFLDQKLQFTYLEASIKDVQVTEEAFSSQKRTSSTSNMKLLIFF